LCERKIIAWFLTLSVHRQLARSASESLARAHCVTPPSSNKFHSSICVLFVWGKCWVEKKKSENHCWEKKNNHREKYDEWQKRNPEKMLSGENETGKTMLRGG
jgi:hypothetical protein